MTDPDPADLPESTYEALRLQMRRVAGMFASRNGELIRELVADSQGNPALAKDFRDRFFAHRRARGAATLEKGIDTGELRPDLDVEDALDVLYGPFWLRLLVGHRPVGQAAADELLELVWPGLKNEPVAPPPKKTTGHQRSNDSAADPRVMTTEKPHRGT